MKKKEERVISRYNPNFAEGLSEEIVKQRQLDKLVNDTKQKSSKSYLKIFADNLFTFFNLIYLIIFVATIVLMTKFNQGSVGDLLFVVIISANIIIAIWQEIKSKKTVERLNLVTMPKVTVIRAGKEKKIFSKNIVLDDVIKLTTGNQVPADAVVLDGKVEVNESLLTGESDAIKKDVSDTLYAGSFIISGTVYARVDKVGKDSYIQTIAKQAKRFSAPRSNLNKDMNRLVKIIGIMIIPVAGLLAFAGFVDCGDWPLAIKKTFGAVIGMVPAGMFLLITIALSMGVVKLAKKNTLVQNMYSIEMLARTNVLCLDKTGTITDGTMKVVDVIALSKKEYDINEIVANMLSAQRSGNVTSNALVDRFSNKATLEIEKNIEFSSKRKHMATQFKGIGVFALGAPEFVNVELKKEQQEIYFAESNKGNRVLLLAKGAAFDGDNLPEKMEPIAFITIEDHIRDDAIDTINWFKNNGVDIKIISGDNPVTVANIAKKVGVEKADKFISLEGIAIDDIDTIADNYTVFGRVSPEQKYALIKALKAKGKVVAMTGDGVNDTLALKEADCSIAMADGSEVARGLSNIVLMDSKFSSLPQVVREGRQVVNNVQQSSSLYLMKTTLTFLLSFISIVTLSMYPFSSGQMLLLEMFVIGLPSVLLALQPNDKLIEGDFLPMVLKKSVPYGFVMFLSVLVCMILQKVGILASQLEQDSACILMILITGFLNLVLICKPFNLLKRITVVMSGSLISVGLVVAYFFPKLLWETKYSVNVLIVVAILTALCLPVYIFTPKLFAKIYAAIEKFKEKHRAKQKSEASPIKPEKEQKTEEQKEIIEIEK